MADISDADRAKFAFLVARMWASQGAGGEQEAAAQTAPSVELLKQFDVRLPKEQALQVPPRPEGDLGSAWMGLTFDHWDVKIDKLPPDAASISVSSLACAACPVSCFSSLSN